MRFILMVSILFGVLHPVAAAATVETQIQAGVAWLAANQSADGSWDGADTTFRDTTTVLVTLKQLSQPGTTFDSGLQWVRTHPVNSADYISRKMELFTLIGDSVSGGAARLLSNQNPDGGWGIAPGFESDVLDTALAVRALADVSGVGSSILNRANDYLLAAQNADGSWGLRAGEPGSVSITALVMRALQHQQSTATISLALSGGVSYLLAHQNTDGGFGSSPSTAWETALVFQELVRSSVQFAKASAAISYISSNQLGNGSWETDPFSTALALQALNDSLLLQQDLDNDGDGFTERQGDCNDNNLFIHPGASDLTVNGIDEDCNGIDGPPVGSIDADGDGFTVAQGDCDDLNPNIHPGAFDIPNNGIDEDCDGKDSVSIVQITSVSLSKLVNTQKIATTVFGAYDTAIIEVSISDPSARPTVFVTGSNGQALNARLDSEVFFFDTQNRPPGNYTVVARAIDKNSGILLDEKMVPFAIESTIQISDGLLGVTPRFTYVGNAEMVLLSLSAANRSNVPLNLTIQYEIKSPGGAVINSGTVPLNTTSEITTPSLTLVTFSHTFVESGSYPVQAKLFNGELLLSTIDSAISAAPAVRINPSKTLTPQTVTPDGDKRIRINIRLEGVEQKASSGVDIYVSTFPSDSNGKIYKIDSLTGAQTVIASGFQYADIAIDKNRILYIGGAFNGVKRIDTLTGIQLPDVGTNICGPSGPTIDAAGNVYFSTGYVCGHSGIWKITGGTATTATQIIPPYAGGLSTGTALLTQGPYAGCLIAAELNGEGRIFRSCPPDFGTAVPFSKPGSPIGIAVNSAGDIFISRYLFDATAFGDIVRYDPNGVFKGVFATLSSLPQYIEFDSADNLYVVESDATENPTGRVTRISPDGVKNTIATGLVQPTGIAVAPK